MLPKLPLPTISDAVDGLIGAYEPLEPSADFKLTRDTLNALKTDPLINVLHQHLKDYNDKHECYLDLFSNVRDHNATNIYSEYRGKSLPKNPYFIVENDPMHWLLKPPSQSERAAILTFSTLKFISVLKRGLLEPDVTPKSEKPLTMTSFDYLFGSTRFPSENISGINIKQFPEARHVIILCASNFYYLEVFNEEYDILVGQSTLEKIFREILLEEDGKVGISSITSESRDRWRKLRKALHNDLINSEVMEKIDSGLLVINLDKNEFIVDDHASQYLDICHGISRMETGQQKGSCNSRWYDKLQLIVSKDSLAAVVWEPTSNDANVVLRYVSDIYTDSILRLARSINQLNEYSLWMDIRVKDDGNHEFYKLNWNFKDAKFLLNLHLAETRLGDLLWQFDERTRKIQFGKTQAEEYNLNFDSLLQLAVQLTHYALYGKCVSSCESISTRMYQHLRSELCFIQSAKILKICQIFISNDEQKQWSIVQQGVAEISRAKKRSREGKGFEKYFKALKLSYSQREYLNQISSAGVPPIPSVTENAAPGFLFDERMFNLIFEPEILAINCGNPSLKLFGITPSKPNGFGLGYIVKNDHTVVNLSLNFRQNDRFLDTLEWVLQDMDSLFRSRPNPATTASYMTLGGYGYFDVGNLESRGQSRQLSRVQSRDEM